MSDIETLQWLQELQRRIEHLERLENTMANSYGYVNSAWQKDPIRLGYSNTYREEVNNTSLGSGTNNLDGTAVPTGEVWVIEHIAMRYTGTVTNVTLFATIYDGTMPYELYQEDGLTSGKYYGRSVSLTLKAGDRIRMVVTGATATDDGYLRIIGRKIDIDL